MKPIDEAPSLPRSPATILGTLALAWGSLGVIYGDIGTSPLYVYATIFAEKVPSKVDVLGALSLIFWVLTLVVLVKYVGVVMLADDDGEGGTFALYTLLCRRIGIKPHGQVTNVESKTMRRLVSSSSRDSISRVHRPGGRAWWQRFAISSSTVRRYVRRSRWFQLTLWGLTMAAMGMVIGDGVLTPAISVMSAVSGLKVATSAVTQSTVVGVAIAILIVLYCAQSLGTHKISFTFAPIVAIWLLFNAGVAVYNLSEYGGEVFKGLSPHYIVKFFQNNGIAGWHMLGGVMLCVTGAEALYADLGHFSHASIVAGFVVFVYPCLALTYIGQAAFLLRHPDDVSETFWKSTPTPFFYPMLVMASLASIVASQALITASFSIVSNAIRLGAFPKLFVKHTSQKVRGQIYIAEVNYTLMLLCVAVVAGFQDTVALGNAYGLTISAVFVVTTLLVSFCMLSVWEVSLPLVVAFAASFLLIDVAFLSANLLKVPEGGWFALAVSAAVTYVMIVWWIGSRKRRAKVQELQVLNSDISELFVPLTRSFRLSMPGTAAGEEATPSSRSSASPATAANGGAQLVPQPQPASVAATPLGTAPSVGHPCVGLMVPGNSRTLLLARQPGMGVYYSESIVGLPYVMLHFLKNVKVVHQVTVFLTVRTMPIPFVVPEQRLSAWPLCRVTNFYQVVACYGYLDRVNQGPEFMASVTSAIEEVLHRNSNGRQQPAGAILATFPTAPSVASSAGQAAVAAPVDAAVPVDASSVLVNPPPPPASPEDDANDDSDDDEVVAAASGAAGVDDIEIAAAPAAVPLSVRTQSGAHFDAAIARRRTSEAGGRDGESAARVLQVRQAAEQGVVYYFGFIRVLADPTGSAWNQLLYGSLYRFLMMLSHSRIEEWQVPYERVVELAITLRL